MRSAPLLAALTLLAGASPAQAQDQGIIPLPYRTLVSNTGQATNDTQRPLDTPRGQAFTTGTNADGYTLWKIIMSGGFSTTTGTVTLHSGSRTGTKVADFNNTVDNANLVVTPTSTTILAASTTYYIVTGDDHDENNKWHTKNSVNEDLDRLPNWSIANRNEYYLITQGRGAWVRGLKPYGIDVLGMPIPPDTTAPRVKSVRLHKPNHIQESTVPTNADTLTWEVQFTEEVKNVDAADFVVVGTTATVTVADVLESTIYNVTASGGDLPDLNGAVTLEFASDRDIKDLADNALRRVTPTQVNYKTFGVDNTAPTVTSIVRQDPTTSPTKEDTLKWRVTFSERVRGVGTADFEVAGTTATVTVGEATASTVYRDVTASGGNLAGLNGTVTLSFASGHDIKDRATNALTATTPTGTNNNTYVVDNTAPTVTSIVRQTPTSSPTNADTLKWRVTFSENVKNVGTADFEVAGTTATVTVAEVTASTVYDVTASGGNLADRNGTVTLSFASGQDIADIADNALTATTPTGTNNNTYVVNNTAPTVTSIVRQDPMTSPTNADTLKWRVTFSENVKNVGTADFEVAGTTATVAVAEVTASTVYDVTASGGNLAGLNGTVTLSFASGQDIADNVNNALTATTPTGTNNNTYVVDNTAPTVTSIVRQDPTTSPTNADTLKWRVTFSEDVKNVGTDDFEVAGTTATVTVAEVTASTVYDVTASEGNLADRNGTVTLSFASGQDIADIADNALTATTPTGTNNNTYVVNNTAPTVTSIVRQDPMTSPTNADTLKWRVMFSENVKNVGTADFAVAGTTATVTVAEVTASTVYDVTASGGNLAGLNGTVTLSFASGQDIADIADNALTATTPTGTNNNTYVVNNTAPTVTSIVRQDPTTSPTNADTLKWRVTFSENVKNVGTADFEVAGTTATVTVAEVTASTVYDVTVSGGNLAGLNGTVTLSFASGQDIADNVNNALTATTPTGTNNNTYVVDNTAPTVTSIVRQTPTSSPTNADTLKWRVTFSENVKNVGTADFEVAGTTATVTVAEVTASTVYDVTASGGNLAGLDGTVTLSFASGQDIADSADNALTATTPTGTNNNTYVVDNTGPAVTSIVRQDPTTSPTKEDTLKWRVTFGKDVKNVGTADFEVAGTTATVTVAEVTASTVYDVTASGGNLAGLNGTVTLSFASGQDIADNMNNALTVTTPTGTNNNTYVVDNTAPTVTSIVRQTPTSSPTNADTLKWRVTFSENVNNLGTADFAVAGTTATVTDVSVVTASTVYDVTVSGGNLAGLDGTVTLSFASGQDIADIADNALTVTTPTGTNNNTYVVNNTGPKVTSIVRQTPTSSPTNADTLKWRVTFSENVKNVGTADFAVAGTMATVTDVSVVTASTVYDVTVSGGNLAGLDGTLTLSFASGQDIADNADNALTVTTPTGTNNNTYVVDNTAPTVTSIVRQDPTTTPTNEDTLKWRVTFSENVKNVGTADFEVAGTTATVTVAEVTASTVYDVTVSGGNLAGLDGTLTLSFASGQDIADIADNALTVTTPTGTNNNTYVVDNTAPTVTSIVRQDPTTTPTNEDTLTWRVTFSENVKNVGTTDFEVAGTTATVTDVSVVTASTVYDVTVSGGNLAGLNGTVTLSFVSGQDIADIADNALTATTPTGTNHNTYMVSNRRRQPQRSRDNTAPTVTSIDRQEPTSSPTNEDTLTWRVTFSENVKNVGMADFEVAGTTATVTVAEVTASTVYDVTASGGNLAGLNGTVTLSFASGQDIADLALANNTLTATTPMGTNDNTFVVDNTAPTVAITGAPATFTDPFTAAFTFSEAVTGFTVGDITVRNGTAGTFTETTDTVCTALITPTATGRIMVDVGAGVATDAAGNPNTAATQVISNYTASVPVPTTKELTREWTSRFGSTVAEQVLDAVESRMQASRVPGFEVNLAGENIRPRPPLLFGAEAEEETSGSDGSEFVSGGDVARARTWSRALTQQDLLLGSSFHVASEGGDLGGDLGGGTIAVWGRGVLSHFDGGDNDLTLDGEVTSGMLGADWSRERTLAGLIVGTSDGDGDYQAPEGDGVVSSTVTGVYPWGRHGLTERIDVWGTVGYGKGTLELTPDGKGKGKGTISADLDMWMVASGLQGTLVDGGLDGFTLTGKTEAMMVEISTAAVAGQLAASEAGVTRLRLGLEGSIPVAVGDGQVLTPSLELGLRHDGGDGDTGFGADMGAGIAWTDQQSGIDVHLRGRGLLTHEANGFREHGISGSLGWDPAPGSDLGPSFSVTQSFGGASSGGADALLQRSTLAGLATNDNGTVADDLTVGRLEARFGYGLPVFGYGWTLTPELGVSLSDTGRDYSVDWGLVRQVPLGDIGALDISLGVRRRESTASADTPEHKAALQLNIRW